MSVADRADPVPEALAAPDHPFVSYAQNREDVVLARALRPDWTTGFWIDVGAGDPRHDSVTAAFADRGWRGINIEPLRSEYERLVADRPRDINLCVAVGERPGLATLFQGPDENRGSSTLRPELAARYAENGQDFTATQVRVTTLAQVVADHAPVTVDLLKVDVEGFEAEVLAGADWSTFRPRVVVVEATIPNTSEPSHESWEPMLLEQGYRLALFDGLNRFYAPADDADVLAALSVPANVLDHDVPYLWVSRVEECERWAKSLATELTAVRGDLEQVTRERVSAAKEARYARDRAAIAEEATAVALEELAASAVLTSRALAEADEMRGVTAAADQASEAARAEVSTLRPALEQRTAAIAAARAEAEAARMEIDAARAETDAARAEVVALRATRTFEYTKGLRGIYHRIRALLRVQDRHP